MTDDVEPPSIGELASILDAGNQRRIGQPTYFRARSMMPGSTSRDVLDSVRLAGAIGQARP